jgi:hypothetical protein
MISGMRVVDYETLDILRALLERSFTTLQALGP